VRLCLQPNKYADIFSIKEMLQPFFFYDRLLFPPHAKSLTVLRSRDRIFFFIEGVGAHQFFKAFHYIMQRINVRTRAATQ
jgi:hypothetical protein